MKTNKFLFVAVFCVAEFLLTVSAGAAAYTLDEYLALVEKNNSDLALAQKEIALAKNNTQAAFSALLPNIGLQAGYTRNLLDRMQNTPVASQAGGGELIYKEIDSNKNNEFSFGVGLNQTIFDAAALANWDKAKKGAAIQGEVLALTRARVINAAKKLYAQTQLAQMLVAISESSEKTSRDVYESISRKYSVGAATELDLLMAEVDYKSKILATVQARKNAGIVLIAFCDLAGVPHDKNVTLQGFSGDIPEVPVSVEILDVLASRPDYRALVLQDKLSQVGQKSAIASFLPRITGSFSFAYGGMGDNSLTGDYGYTASQITLGVTLPLFTGTYRIAALKSANIEKEKSALNLVKKRTAIESEIAELVLRITESRKRAIQAQLVETTAKRALLLAQAAYTNGATTQLNVSEASNRLDGASLGLQNALYEYRAAYYDWELAVGGF